MRHVKKIQKRIERRKNFELDGTLKNHAGTKCKKCSFSLLLIGTKRIEAETNCADVKTILPVLPASKN